MNMSCRILPLVFSLAVLLALPRPAVAAAEPDPGALARQLLDTAGVRGGLVVHLGCGDGRLTAALRAGPQYLVHGLATDAGQVQTARETIKSQGLYGEVSADRFDGKHLPYVDNLVNLLVVSGPSLVEKDELLRVLSPGGVAVLLTNDKGPMANDQFVKPWPAEIDQWTHYLHDASNNAVAQDRVVGPPQGYQWVAGPRWARSHDHLSTFSALVSAGGRIFTIYDEGPAASVALPPRWQLAARDAFSGVLLWKRPIESWEGHLRDFRTGPTELSRRLVAHGDRVFVTLGYGQPVSVLEAASGETIRVCDGTENALEIIFHDGVLFVVAGDRPPDNIDGAAIPRDPQRLWQWWPIWEETPPRKRLVAIDADSGRVRWAKDDAAAAQLLPTTLAAAGSRVFFQDYDGIVALDARTGRELWRAERPVNRRRPTWSTPTLVVYGDVVLSGDRAVQGALPPDAPDAQQSTQWVVNSSGGSAPPGKLAAFSAETGKPLWEAPCRECYNAPVDVLVADGLVWSGDLVSKRDPGITVARDVKTGQVKRQRPADQDFFAIVMGHHRCYRNKATEEYLVMGRDGIELIDLDSGQGWGHAWVRGSCQYGVMPCNGLIYSPPHSCACHIESKLNSFNVLAPARSGRAATAEAPAAERLERGPAYGELSSRSADVTAADSADWPTYRHDAARSGRSSCAVPAELKPAWEATLDGGPISCPVVAEGKVLVASIDTHTVHALDAAGGRLAWSFTAGGRVDSPPTVHHGSAIFGSADGWIYAVRVADGRLAWRFRAAPEDRRIVSYEQLESAWPLHGSVLVLNDTVYAVAGRTAFLDGGMVLCRLDAATGRLLGETPITTAALPDVLSSDGQSVFLRHRRFDLQGGEQPSDVAHLYSPAGFLDDSWWHRTYWILGTNMRSGWGSWPDSGNQFPAGRLLVLDDSAVYGFGRFNQYHRNGSHVGLGSTRYLLYRADRNSDATGAEQAARAQRPGVKPAPHGVAARWSRTLPLLARAMVLSGRTLFVAGPPDVFRYADDPNGHPYRSPPEQSIADQQAALDGRLGGRLWAVSADDGAQLAEYRLDAPPQWDGIAAANDSLFLSIQGGRVLCFSGQ